MAPTVKRLTLSKFFLEIFTAVAVFAITHVMCW